MINWDEVTVGETEVEVARNPHRQTIIGLHNDKVWLHAKATGQYQFCHRDFLSDWTIYDPWVDVSGECEWRPFGLSDNLWVVEYEGEIIRHNDSRFKVECPRVWKRKEW